ncbi:hypothetical protein [Rhodococcus koreensis]|uniref:Uncharacterized protein n=1 Tax=Rhodococcus koreensis TaxID=99653 RepID=A0A1H5ENM4_9NOCA|nr:hypothetical protein [Rhodococcus koreensis]SED92669.1 hypothetical protein SAMN04490239_9301 [Rhodococcus koreensis]
MTDKTDAQDICTVLDPTRYDEASDTRSHAPDAAFAAGAPGISGMAAAATLAGGAIGGLLRPITTPHL